MNNEVTKPSDDMPMAASIESLLQKFLPTPDYICSPNYVLAFLLSGRLYLKVSQILNELGQVVLYQELKTDSAKQSLVNNVVSIVEIWTQNFAYDFLDRKMVDLLKDICQNSVELVPSVKQRVNDLTNDLVQKIDAAIQYEQNLAKLIQNCSLRLEQTPTQVDILDICPSSLAVAHQLTHIEMDRLRFISPEEFVQAFVKENNSRLKNISVEVKNVKCLEAYVQWFNRLTYFVSSEICSHVKRRNRVKVLEYFIDVAKECFNIGNFNSCMSIIAGLNMSQVSRLKRTWIKVSNMDKFEVLEHQMDPSNNFNCYRSTLKAAIWRTEGATDMREKIIIPFFSLFLKDLYFLNESSASKMENGSINFEKFLQVSKQINDFMKWRSIECPFERREPIIHYLLTSPVFSEDALSMASFECEPPDKMYEKVQHRQLKDMVTKC